jgi:hypothetical protein
MPDHTMVIDRIFIASYIRADLPQKSVIPFCGSEPKISFRYDW